jgi:hypothetical protein
MSNGQDWLIKEILTTEEKPVVAEAAAAAPQAAKQYIPDLTEEWPAWVKQNMGPQRQNPYS